MPGRSLADHVVLLAQSDVDAALAAKRRLLLFLVTRGSPLGCRSAYGITDGFACIRSFIFVVVLSLDVFQWIFSGPPVDPPVDPHWIASMDGTFFLESCAKAAHR